MTIDHSACSVVRDLLPLYLEELVSEETRAYIETHLAACPACNDELALLRREPPADTSPDEGTDTPPLRDASQELAPLKKIKRRLDLRLHSVAYLALIFFSLFGFSLSAGADIMYNSLIMPIVGILGYLTFGWRAVYKVPLLLVVIDALALLMQLVDAYPLDMVAFTLLYTIFALVGVAIAYLLHFVFRREKS